MVLGNVDCAICIDIRRFVFVRFGGDESVSVLDYGMYYTYEAAHSLNHNNNLLFPYISNTQEIFHSNSIHSNSCTTDPTHFFKRFKRWDMGSDLGTKAQVIYLNRNKDEVKNGITDFVDVGSH